MNRTAAVTGAASGIGQAACRRLLDSGWTVFGMDNASARLDAVAAMSDPAASKGYQPSGVSPVGRIAQPDDVVDVMMFLLSDGARYLAGTTIPVDGGTAAAFVPPGSNR